MFIKKISTLIFIGLLSYLQADVLKGKVVGISDGDTIKILTQDDKLYKIRLNDIDAPEKSQAFGNKSKENLSNYIFERYVTVEYKNIDRYQRILGTVYYQGEDINIQQVKDGFAWVYKQYSNKIEYYKAEVEAKATKRGLWMDNNPIEPWNYRKKNK
ncbi:thermonuclease family protein [Aliarcobacter butzleri]|uniref:thermonuclease family protein n=1 Tax=Aliarcobacter butzleri TaxID=28197 RepID=UPI001EDAAF16|nr:thermonuclease family protein [Aliarcobacter butzleri]MCG3705618.1 thermonuclease family protein [Aliarcobacter butzleri]